MTISYNAAKEIFERENLFLCEMHYQQFCIYLQELIEANRYMNLTAITEPYEVWTKHFLDCAVMLQKLSLSLGSVCIDVGTGAGFPGIVMAILRPDLKVTLLDSLKKRIDFLRNLVDKLALEHVCCIHGRAEDMARLCDYREKFDFVTARAVAALPVLTEYCMPFLKMDGYFAAMKGPSEDASCAENALDVLGGVLASDVVYSLKDVGERRLIVVKKNQITPDIYPRRSDKIKKMPL